MKSYTKSLLKWLSSLSELQLYSLICDLLKNMGYKDVTITHGPLEHGRDICFSEVDKLGRKLWRGIQVKSSAASGSLSNEKGIRALVTQCEASLDTPYITQNCEEVLLSEIWIIISHQLSEHAKLSIIGKFRNKMPIYIIDSVSLSDLLKQYLPDLTRSGSGIIEDYLNNLMSFCDLPEDYLSIRLRVKYFISDVFIDPVVTIKILDQKRLGEKRILDRLNLFFENVKLYKQLSDMNLLPFREYYKIIEVIILLRDIASEIKYIPSLGIPDKENYEELIKGFSEEVLNTNLNNFSHTEISQLLNYYKSDFNKNTIMKYEKDLIEKYQKDIADQGLNWDKESNQEEDVSEVNNLVIYTNLKSRMERYEKIKRYAGSMSRPLVSMYYQMDHSDNLDEDNNLAKQFSKAKLTRNQFFDKLTP